MSRESDAHFMELALALAKGSPHRTSPNPTVGCILVRGGEVIAQGVTLPAGQPHAEVVALTAAGDAADGAEMFVTLEPCSHTGRTPPCTTAIIASKVKRVVAGVIDPNPLVNGRGLALLKNAGVETEVGVLGEACATHLAPFRRFILEKRPWLMLKAAVSLDGRIATLSGHSQWITGQAARADVHRLRAKVDAVMVGAETARLDDPRLTVRHVTGEDPRRVVVTSDARLDPGANLLGSGSIVLHGHDAPPDRVAALSQTGADVIAIHRSDAGLDLEEGVRALAKRQIVSVLVEGGGALHGALLAARLADEAVFYIAPKLIGRGRPVIDVPSVPRIDEGWRLDPVEITPMGADVRVRGPIRYPDEGER